MTVSFYKYHGTGNDFIIIDDRKMGFNYVQELIANLCHRRFGIGADGLMLLQHATGHDFSMIYFNADGRESTMCGNGGRCMTAFAKKLGIINDQAFFRAIDGDHISTIDEQGIVSLQMNDVNEIKYFEGYSILNTGSPHYVIGVDDVGVIDIIGQGRAIRNRQEFMPNGINVNFVQKTEKGLSVRTYERGVEDETLSCGTGVTAAAIAASCTDTGDFATHIHTPGGELHVSFKKTTPFTAADVVLTGPAVFVYQGVYIV